MDPIGLVKRHYLAPRASTQEQMNNYMRGEEWDLAERYTAMTKIIFPTLWYCSTHPAGFFLCALALFINYFTDRYNLMRTWRQGPKLGSNISTFSRRFFFPMATCAMAVASSYTWAGYPYDNLCESNGQEGNVDDDALEDFVGTWDATLGDGSGSVELTVSEGDSYFQFCRQSLYWYGARIQFSGDSILADGRR